MNPDQQLHDDVASGAIQTPEVRTAHLESPMTTTDYREGLVLVTRHRFGGVRVVGVGPTVLLALVNLSEELTKADA